jgi:hypothetical protein
MSRVAERSALGTRHGPCMNTRKNGVLKSFFQLKILHTEKRKENTPTPFAQV